jgi:pimeloyl-ACP methyl ester carboxylesterase
MRKEFTYRSATISYRVEGQGKPVILIHGFGEDGEIWNGQAAFLKDYCMLIIPDLPGSGRSTLLSLESEVRSLKWEEKNSATPDSRLQTPDFILIDDYAACIHELLKYENISSCTMLGHSMGGYITLAFAEKYPSALNAFGLLHSTAFADSEEKKKLRERGIETIEQYGAHAFLKTTIPNLFGKRFKEQNSAKKHYSNITGP